MTRDELKRHCQNQIEGCEIWAIHRGEEPHGRVYEEHKLVLELLEQEPCEDAISRQAVINAIGNTCFWLSADNWTELMRCIHSVPTVTPQPKTQWIPVSERLPEIHQDVLLSFRSLNIEVGFRAKTEPYYSADGCYIEPQNVLAWQPLPEPYKLESEE